MINTAVVVVRLYWFHNKLQNIGSIPSEILLNYSSSVKAISANPLDASERLPC